MEARKWQKLLGYLAHCLLAMILVVRRKMSLRDALKIMLGKGRLTEHYPERDQEEQW